jgi:16S rRNA (uracil1498-N3)-methyltransferase
MRMPRFYSATALPRALPPSNDSGANFFVDAAVAQHIRVLRLGAGEVVHLFDGREPEGEWHATLQHVDKREVTLRLDAWHARSAESLLNVSLFQALAVGDKMDWVIQKAVELGAHEIVPMRTARATLKLDAERAEKRVAHWQAVAIAACEQCGRNRVPQVQPILSFEAAMAMPHTKAMLSPSADVGLATWLRSAHQDHAVARLAILVGPEGGFTTDELALAARHGATPVSIGPRVLRTETAGIAALALMQATAGDLG